MDKRKIKTYGNIIQIIIAACIFFILFSKIDAGSFAHIARTLHIPYFSLALFLTGAGVFLSAYKWRLLLQSMDIAISYAHATKLYFIGGFFNCFLPTTVGGDIIKIASLKKDAKSLERIISATFMDRFSGIIAVAMLLFFANFLHQGFLKNNPSVAFLSASIIMIVALACAVLFYRPLAKTTVSLIVCALPRAHRNNIKQHANNFFDSLRLCAGRTQTFFAALGISAAFHLLTVAIFYFLGRAVGMESTFAYALLFTPLILCITMIPNSFHGIGLQEGIAYFLFSRIGTEVEKIILFSFLIHGVVFIVYFFGGILYIFDRIKSIRTQ